MFSVPSTQHCYCLRQVPKSVIMEVASLADKQRYEAFAQRSYVEDNRCATFRILGFRVSLAWLHAQLGCNVAVYLQSRSEQRIQIPIWWCGATALWCECRGLAEALRRVGQGVPSGKLVTCCARRPALVRGLLCCCSSVKLCAGRLGQVGGVGSIWNTSGHVGPHLLHRAMLIPRT